MLPFMAGPDSSAVRALTEENAQLRTKLKHGSPSLSLPPTPPDSPTKAEPASHVQLAPLPTVEVPPDQNAQLNDMFVWFQQQQAQMAAQAAAQAAAQEALLIQLAELRCSHANLKATTADVNDELLVLREKASLLSAEVESERQKREQIEKEKAEEAERVRQLSEAVRASGAMVTRLQEAAAKRESESRSRRGSVMGTPGSSIFSLGPDSRRSSLASVGPMSRRVSMITGLDAASLPKKNDLRRASLTGGVALALDAQRYGNDGTKPIERRASSALPSRLDAASTFSSPGSIGLGLDFEGAPVAPLDKKSSRRHSARGSFSHRRGSSLSMYNPPSEEPVDGRTGLKSMILMPSDPVAGDASVPSTSVRRLSSLNLSTRIDEDGLEIAPINLRSSLSNRNNSLRKSFDLGGMAGRSNSTAGLATDSAEVMLLRAQLQAAKAKLAETEEAKEASDTCLKALKEYISAPEDGKTGLRLPPLPTESADDSTDVFASNGPAPQSVGRRGSLWNLSALAGLARSDSTSDVPVRQLSVTEDTMVKKVSPVLTAFNGWSARKIAAAARERDQVKPSRSPVASPDMARSSMPPSTFGDFSFQSRTRNPALLDSPSSPSGGHLSPGGSSRSISPPALSDSNSACDSSPPDSPTLPDVYLIPDAFRRPQKVSKRPALPRIESHSYSDTTASPSTPRGPLSGQFPSLVPSPMEPGTAY